MKSTENSYRQDDRNMFQPLDFFRVIIHSPEELPYRSGHHYFHGRHEGAFIDVVTEKKKIDEVMESWTPEQRNCFMEHEKKLKFYKIYTKANCEHECLSHAMLRACSCVPFYIIRELRNDSVLFITLNYFQEAPVTGFAVFSIETATRWSKGIWMSLLNVSV